MKRAAALRSLSALMLAAPRPLSARAADETTVRVAYEPLNTLSAFYAALDAGFFRKSGLSVDAQPMNSGSAMGSAVVSGSVELGVVNVLSLAQAYEKTVPLTYIAMASLYSSVSPADALMVPKGSPVASARDLNGKTVAINVLKGLAYLGTRTWLDRNGGDSTTVRFVEMPFDAMPAALASHSIDAALVADPALQKAKQDSRVLSYAYNSIAPTFLISGWVASQSWVASHGDLARRFGDALQEAQNWADRNPQKTAEISARFLKMDVATLRSMARAPYPDKRRAVALAQPVINAAAKYGVLRSAFPAAELFSRDVIRSGG
jgi:NitT/TauT family transport system substrate-binding protein